MDYTKFDDTIKAWLLGKLSAPEKATFEAQVRTDEGLKNYTFEQRLAFQILRKARAAELEQQFREWSSDTVVTEQPNNFWRIKPWKAGMAAIFALAAVVTAYFWGTNARQGQIVTLQQQIDSIAAVNQRLQNALITQNPDTTIISKIKEKQVVSPNYGQIFAKDYRKTDFGNQLSSTRASLDSARLLLETKPKVAGAIAQISLDKSKDNPLAWAILAESCFNQQKYADAATAFEQLEAYMPMGKDARWNRLVCYAMIGDTKSFNELYSKTIPEADPSMLKDLKRLKSKF